jgi:NAD(P)-dependent dehydrogenase (short-subunit alcohol dehydrogenase family)
MHYAVNQAGLAGAQAPVGETGFADWDRVIIIDLKGVPDSRLDAGASECGAIVNMSSIHGTVSAIVGGAYTSAKDGVVGLTKNAAAEYSGQGLRINCVGPAYIKTPLPEELPKEFRYALIDRYPLGHLSQPDVVVPLVAFLLSEEA